MLLLKLPDKNLSYTFTEVLNYKKDSSVFLVFCCCSVLMFAHSVKLYENTVNVKVLFIDGFLLLYPHQRQCPIAQDKKENEFNTLLHIKYA